jgi:large subunit ribosomal protein L9
MNTKVILNKDLAPLGEEGDVKEVARGFARNFLFPRGIALPYTTRIVKQFEARKDEIEGRKAQKRQDAQSVKERLEALELTFSVPAGANGKLFGAVTSLTVLDELSRQGFALERKRIEVPGNSIKSVGRYKVAVKLYGSAAAEVTVVVQAHIEKPAEKPAPQKKDRRHRGFDRDDRQDAENAPAPSAQKPVVSDTAAPAAAVSDTAVPAAAVSDTAASAIPAAVVSDTSAAAVSDTAASEPVPEAPV